MDARFDCDISRLSNRARAIDGFMFHREAWDVWSRLDIKASCQLMPYSQGTRGRGGFASKPCGWSWVPPTARPAQGHKICKGEAFASLFRRPQSAFPLREVQDELQPPSPDRRNAVRGCQDLGIRDTHLEYPLPQKTDACKAVCFPVIEL